MTTNEFIKKARALDFVKTVENVGDDIGLYDSNGAPLALVGINERYTVNVSSNIFEALPEEYRRRLFNLCTEYACTPIEARRKVRRYKLKLKLPIPQDSLNEYLNCHRATDRYITSNAVDDESYQTLFTQSEINKIKAKYGDTYLDSFEQIEVVDE